MKIGIASDHHGHNKRKMVKKYLEKLGHEVIDYGPTTKEMVDFPDYAISVALKVSLGEHDLGILFCGTGIGMSIAANKVKGIRAAKLNSIADAKLAKAHNNANIITFSSKEHDFKIKDMIDKFLITKLSEEPRYNNRNLKIKAYEDAL